LVRKFEPVDDKNVSEEKKSMKLIQFLAFSGFVLFIVACGAPKSGLNIVESKSFNVKQISLRESFAKKYLSESTDSIQLSNDQDKNLSGLITLAKLIKETKSDSSWFILKRKWEEFNQTVIGSSVDTSANSYAVLQKWAELNADLLKFSGEVQFADALEKQMYQPKPILNEQFMKSIIYTHNYDQIYVNLFLSSTLTHYHTTGGTIKLVQETEFPKSNEITLRCETDDVRYLDIFIRIPEWAVNPKVSHGNVKYVAHPGEYCQISRKWNDGDEIVVQLKN
jgi:hypothetical protein